MSSWRLRAGGSEGSGGVHLEPLNGEVRLHVEHLECDPEEEKDGDAHDREREDPREHLTRERGVEFGARRRLEQTNSPHERP